jgi:hypothetical protein
MKSQVAQQNARKVRRKIAGSLYHIKDETDSQAVAQLVANTL